ncbi:MAG: hypothetical protein ACJ79S_20425, partial [Gemmatimonadaceae bacterium]
MTSAARPVRTPPPPRPGALDAPPHARRVPGRSLVPPRDERGPRAVAERLRGWRVALAVTALVAATAIVPHAALRDAETLGAAAGATLVRPTASGSLAPFYTVSDELALLSV